MLRSGEVVGITPTGRATVRLLDMNSPQRIDLRELWLDDGDAGLTIDELLRLLS